MEHIRARCPACQKLYQVETQSIYSHSPHFDCKACHSIFTFQFPPIGDGSENPEVATFLVQNSSENLEETPAVILQAEPSLVQLWNHIFEDYDDHERHEDFVKRCIELEALSYAQTKYQELKAALGSDELCDRYLLQIEARMLVKSDLKTRAANAQSQALDLKLFAVWLQARNWKKVIYWAPVVLGTLMVLIGFSNLNLRNMIGVGVAVTFLGYGLITILYGRIQVSDFIDSRRSKN